MRILLRTMFGGLLMLLFACEQPKVVGRRVGNLAPDLAGTDAKGKVVTLGELKGQVVLLDFWATWCGPCRMMIPHEKELVKYYKGRPFTILGIACDDRPAIEQYLQFDPLPWTNIVDESRVISQSWNADSIPLFYLIDHRGVILKVHEGTFSANDSLNDAIKAAVKNAEEAK